MSLRLILTRHAKSSWDDPTLTDHARPLNARGRSAARAIGAWLRERGDVPELVLSSDSRRTRETWEEMEAALQSGAEVRWLPELYHAPPHDILAALRRAGAASPVLLVAHNPGVGLAARALVSEPPRHARFERYPTAATTVIDMPVNDWSETEWGMGEVAAFTVPRDLG
ncbi:phosphohistidine phosphatase [Meinhardsimonia xiamenensis]|jgi:phosphohistidine phosphatase|uniref:Phosphohistidine phosphatase n=1 Tax=Meinhardsimonia xiamenensis TaxID=990712 RepID=A0A1G9EBC9_9RHOB|nr:histidine phosphatase family protein [Meinhardsimonia xiamenensis]PRX33846.1 phosphohistidine phosphatase [Meinhardsimonia xiamenensis]SDK73460.1 phosphohistidine phosphatase [Meinhardsimonia xiamenensis]